MMLEWRDSEGHIITELSLGVVIRGRSTGAFIAVLVNNSPDIIPHLQLTPYLAVEDLGREIDTVGSTLLSTDQINWYHTLVVTVNANEELPIYVKWNPPSDAPTGSVEWSLGAVIDYGSGEEICE